MICLNEIQNSTAQQINSPSYCDNKNIAAQERVFQYAFNIVNIISEYNIITINCFHNN